MQLKDSYDLIVIGDQLSGLFLAAGAAQLGKKVLVLEESSTPLISYEIPTGRFLGDFACEPFIGLYADSPMDRFLKSLGLYQNMEDLFPSHSPSLQIVREKMRMDFSYQKENLRSEISREFLHSSKAISDLLEGNVLETGRFSAAVKKLNLPVDFEDYGWMQAILYGAVAEKDIYYSQYKKIISLAARGVHYPLGGRDALKERLQSRIKIFFGDIRRNTRVEEIVFEKGRLAGVLLSSYEGFIRSPKVIGAMAAENFFSLLPNQLRGTKIEQWQKLRRPNFWKFNFSLVVKEASLPEGLGSHACIPFEGNFLQVQVFPKDIYGGIASGSRAIVVRTSLPFSSDQIGAVAVSRHIKKAMKEMKKYFPFLEIQYVSPDPNQIELDPVFQKYYSFSDLAHIPPLFLSYVENSYLDPSELIDGGKLGVPGIGLCSRDIYPLLGGTGEIISAMELLASLKKRADKNT
jgi:hypothetical protein